jgi:hypothetical protein
MEVGYSPVCRICIDVPLLCCSGLNISSEPRVTSCSPWHSGNCCFRSFWEAFISESVTFLPFWRRSSWSQDCHHLFVCYMSVRNMASLPQFNGFSWWCEEQSICGTLSDQTVYTFTICCSTPWLLLFLCTVSAYVRIYLYCLLRLSG